jgi:chorismate mutase/prephenate dehydratase
MPDTTPLATPTTEAPPSEDGWRPDLAVLRARLDRLDDKIHDLLMERALVIENVARSGKAAVFRPGREAEILRRLLARHTGKLPAQTVVRMWREMLAGTTAMQTRVTIAATQTASIAREHFGFLTPVIEYPTARAVLDAVRTGSASIGVLPFPSGPGAWWPALRRVQPHLFILARLPFWAERPLHVPIADALVVGTNAPDASGGDRSFISAPSGDVLKDAGLKVIATHGEVFEVETMVAEGDPRLPPGVLVLGGYAVPVAGEQVVGDGA